MEFRGRVDLTPFTNGEELSLNGICKKYLVVIDGENYIFKQNYSKKDGKRAVEYFEKNFEKNVKEFHNDLIEVFSSYFLKKLGCDFFVPYYFGKINGENGCFSKDFKKDVKNEFTSYIMMINLKRHEKNPKEDFRLEEFHDFFKKYETENPEGQYDLSVFQILETATKFSKEYGFSFDEEKTKKQLEKMVVFDFFMGNNDRRWTNITFLTKEKDGKKVLEIAPIFDNGESFGLKELDRIPSKRNLKTFVHLGLTENGRNFNFEGNKLFENQKLIACDIFELAKKDKDIKKIVDTCLNLDFEDCLDDFEKENGVKLEWKHKQVIKASFNARKLMYRKATKKFQKKLEKIEEKTKRNQEPIF